MFLVGGLAGIIFSQLVLPWLAGFAPFNKVAWICNTKEGTTIINRSERVYLTQELAYQESLAKISGAVVDVRAERGGVILAEGSGFVLTGDGVLVTANSLASKSAAKYLVSWDGKETEVKVIKRDEQNNLVLLKMEGNNLPVVTLGDSASLRLGEMVFLAGADRGQNGTSVFSNVGFIKTLTPEPTVNFTEKPAASGSLMASVKGEVIGLNLVDKNGDIKIVSSEKIRELLK